MSASPHRIVFALVSLAGAASRGQQPPVIRVETRTVLVDAVVTGKKGDDVHDLTAKDFHIWQDGKEQEVTSLSADAQAAEPHFLVLFFDDTRMTAPDQAAARRAAARFIDANTGPRSQMAVVSYNGSLRIAQNFTDNAGRLKDALNRMQTSSGGTTDSTRGQRAAVPTTVADNFGSRGAIESLGNLAKSLGVLPGRKTLVLLTGGLPSSPEMKSSVTAAIEDASRSGVAVYPVNVLPLSSAVDATNVTPNSLGDQFRGRGRGGGRGADDSNGAQDPAASSEPLLMALADGTGGFLTRDSSALLAALQQIGEEQTEHYVLSYTPPESKEGSCHALRVKVDRAGLTVRARASYCATPPADLIAGTPEAKDLETRAAGAEAGDLAASVQLPYFYLSAGVARVHLAMEISVGALKFENEKGKLHAEVNLLGIASTADGGVGARFSDTLKLDYDTQAEVDKLKTTPVHYEKDFKIAPGMYSLAVAFGSGAANSGNFGKIEVPLEVEPWNGSELAVSGVALSRETHPAGDLGLTSLVEDRTPLVAQGAEFIPSGSNQFAKSEAGFFYLEVYDPDPASVNVRLRVVDRKSGASKWDSGSIKLPLQGNAGKVAIPAGASLQINTLAAGPYQLEITASDAAGKQVKRTADFEVK